jgi:3-phenylpropionate/trans-cinnamate dioxygenase ferredoxin reductase subunit
MDTVAIVGASLAGAKAAEGLRDHGFTGRLVLIGEETERPYERPPLSKGYLLGQQPREKAYVHEAHWYPEHDVELLLGVRATNLDAGAHTLILDGYEPLRYDKLLLATGSRVRRLDVPGADLHGVRYLRTLPESDALLDHLRTAGNVVVVGAGWIGLETAAAARTHGATVIVAEVDSAPLRQVLGDEVAGVFTDLHRAQGVAFRFRTGVREFRGLGGELRSVVFTDGTEVPADLAIIAIGIEPAVELAVAAGLAVDNGIAVDAGLRTSHPDVFACGDVASMAHPMIGQRIRVEHWANALNGGRAAAPALLGQPVTYDRVPYFYTDQYDLGMEYSGYAPPGGYDSVVYRGDRAGGEFVVFWVRDSRVMAGMNVNVWDVAEQIQALVRAGYAGQPVDLARLADPEVPLDKLVG